MMRLIDRYVFKELFVPFLIGTAAVVIMFLANVLIAYSGELFRKDIPFSAVGQYLLFKIPQTLNLTLPIGGLQETVTVTGVTPLIDLSSTEVGGNIGTADRRIGGDDS